MNLERLRLVIPSPIAQRLLSRLRRDPKGRSPIDLRRGLRMLVVGEEMTPVSSEACGEAFPGKFLGTKARAESVLVAKKYLGIKTLGQVPGKEVREATQLRLRSEAAR